jgi:membrane protease YdiL (CAAX protease family)
MPPPPQARPTSFWDTRTAAALEILLVLLITVGHRVFRIIPVDETYPILALGWLSLRLRGGGWRGVGLGCPTSWQRTLALGAAVGILLQVLSEFVTEPLFTALTHQPVDVSEFRPLVGNVKLLLLYFVVVWTLAAFGEEMTYRGYLLNRAADLGGRRPWAWAAGLLFITVLFGFGHSYQGLTGMLDSGLHGLLLGVLYLASGRNLWVCVIAHGVTDTIALVAVFLGHL